MNHQEKLSDNDLFLSKYSIYFLHEKPEYIEEMGNIFYNEWKDVYIAFGLNTLNDVIQDMKEKHVCNHNKLPMLMTALDNSNQNLVATIGLEICDVTTGNPYYNITRWLACTYIKDEYRGKGIATYMINRMLQFAQQLNYTYIWLWTEHSRSLYERIGFHFVEKIQHLGKDVDIMRIDFDIKNY
ncbi:unnamed protein product [Adineta steineri]|uniref:N-acetyltransferase domain-containing protein n=1 Tax=Adineta steineri TaxID=433720 RepID=A0A813TN44_9BILA|nr:unnamed protein product [Adineta steineri]CAF3741710.1 unnamed protein product [Adineta steineri]